MKKTFVWLLMTLGVLMGSSPVFAQAQEGGSGIGRYWIVITSGFAMAIASSICALAQGRAISAACEGMARNPGAAPAIRFALLLGLVLIESLALYTLVIIFVKVA